jgi:hypothetical protein
MFDRVQVWALATQRHWDLSGSYFCVDCVLIVVVLLEGEPSPQSEVLSDLEQVFIKYLSVLCSVHLSLITD